MNLHDLCSIPETGLFTFFELLKKTKPNRVIDVDAI